MTVREEIGRIFVKWSLGTRQGAILEVLELMRRTTEEIISVPLKTGDQGENDEVIEDGIREAFVRQTQRDKAKELIR